MIDKALVNILLINDKTTSSHHMMAVTISDLFIPCLSATLYISLFIFSKLIISAAKHGAGLTISIFTVLFSKFRHVVSRCVLELLLILCIMLWHRKITSVYD